MANPDDLEQKVLDAADEPKGDYPCPQCSERYFDSEKIRPCFYCSNRFCVKCRERDSDPVTGETVEICSTCAEKIQELADQERKIRQQAAEIERLNHLISVMQINRDRLFEQLQAKELAKDK